jgi:polyhydroxybutyrate depolymerase
LASVVGFIAACGGGTLEPLDDAGNFAGTITAEGIERTYVVHVPPDNSSVGVLPLVIALHGVPGTGLSMQRFSGLDEPADRLGFVVAYPDARYGEWAVGLDDPTVDFLPDRDTEFIKQLISELDGRFDVDRRRVYATGISNGALMVHHLSCEMAGYFAAVGPVAATMMEPVADRCTPGVSLPIVIMHGSEDDQFPPEGGEGEATTFLSIQGTVALWVGLNGCDPEGAVAVEPDTADDGTSVRRTEYAGCDGGAEVVFYDITGGGHVWPGSPVAYTPPTGQMTRDISASEILLTFFLRHERH